jgi:hypothetical protein
MMRSPIPRGAAALTLLLVLPGCRAPAGVRRAPAGQPPVTVDVAGARYADAPDLIRKLSAIFDAGPGRGDSGLSLVALPGNRGLRLTGPAESVRRVLRLLARPPCDPPRSPGAARVTVIPLRYQDAGTVLGRLPGPLPAGARVSADRPTNSLVIVAPPAEAARLRAWALGQDRPGR